MIIKVERRNKMGIFLSKKKETKRRPEGLMKQSKAIIGDESPPSSPRNLSSTLSSNLLVSQFKTFLHNLDKASGDDDESGRVTSLQFVLDIRELNELAESEKGEYLWRVGDTYFKVPGEGLVLDNNQLWVRCSEVCRSRKTGSEDLKWLLKARDAALKELDELHVVFLANRAPSQLKEIINCIL